MDTPTYAAHTSITVNAPLARVWDALVNPAVVQQYLHDTTMRADWRVGGAIVWRGEWSGTPYVDKGVVLRYEPQQLLSISHWSPLAGTDDKPENYHILTYELSQTGEQTTVTLTQSNSPTQEDADCMISNGWTPVLNKLKQVVEG